MLGALVARSAHEINNALNGAVMNLEVVRLRARPGVDGAGAAPFAGTAAEELERASALVGALIALGRPARPGAAPDVGDVLDQLRTLVGSALAQQRVRLETEGGRRGLLTVAPLDAVRLAVGAAVLAAAEGVRAAGLAVEAAGVDSAREPAHLLRCTLQVGPEPMLRVTVAMGGESHPVVPALPDAATVATLGAAGIVCTTDGAAVVLRFPPVV